MGAGKPLPHSPHGELLRNLLPPVSYDPNGERIARALTADGLALDRAHTRANRVLDGLYPFKSLYWLGRYEDVYALPDECHTGTLSFDERVTQLAVALLERAGLNAAFFVWLGAVYGYEVTVQNYRPFRAGHSCAGDPLTNGNWRYVFTIRSAGKPIKTFRAGRSCAGEPLRQWGDTRFECMIRKFCPAHGLIHFAYE
ncbi:DUF2313 domain-containing protein [Desulfovibrio sp. OttesenSCG-928-G15]|nr:DUF2313 domain-containing protein [Desulfovibrio sp. OttesenSCG-928-G15]